MKNILNSDFLKFPPKHYCHNALYNIFPDKFYIFAYTLQIHKTIKTIITMCDVFILCVVLNTFCIGFIENFACLLLNTVCLEL